VQPGAAQHAQVVTSCQPRTSGEQRGALHPAHSWMSLCFLPSQLSLASLDQRALDDQALTSCLANGSACHGHTAKRKKRVQHLLTRVLHCVPKRRHARVMHTGNGSGLCRQHRKALRAAAAATARKLAQAGTSA